MASTSEQVDQPLRIGALCGSLRQRSTNRALLDAFARQTPPGMTIETDIEIGRLPLFNPDLETRAPESVASFARWIGACDGLLIASPEYAHGMTGALKNALDWLVSGPEIPHKPVMLVHASVRSETSRQHLREVLRTMSCKLWEGEEFAFHLISKTPEEAAALLDEDATGRDMRETLVRFADFIRESA